MLAKPLVWITGMIAALTGTVLVNLLLTELMIDAKNAGQKPQIVTVDAAEILLRFAQSRPASMSDAEWAEELVALNRRIAPAVAALAAEQGIVVLNSAAVLTGAPNFTPQLMSILHQRAANP